MSSPSNAGSLSSKPLPKWPTSFLPPSGITFTANAVPSTSQSSTGRLLFTATVSCGGSNEHCCTQLASIPVSCLPWRTVTTNSPLGTRPSAAARACSWVITPSLLQEFRHQLLDHGVVHVLVLLVRVALFQPPVAG